MNAAHPTLKKRPRYTLTPSWQLSTSDPVKGSYLSYYPTLNGSKILFEIVVMAVAHSVTTAAKILNAKVVIRYVTGVCQVCQAWEELQLSLDRHALSRSHHASYQLVTFIEPVNAFFSTPRDYKA